MNLSREEVSKLVPGESISWHRTVARKQNKKTLNLQYFMFFQIQNNIIFVRKDSYDYKPTFIG